MNKEKTQILWLNSLKRNDVPEVGGKNASLGELISELKGQGIAVPPGFATTAAAYWDFVLANQLAPVIETNIKMLMEDKLPLADAGAAIRAAFLAGAWPDSTAQQIKEAYAQLCETTETENCPVAVRSSATAEDLPEASFAGQQESFLNIRGGEALLEASKQCYASLFTDRAIEYRNAKGFDHKSIALSVGIQQMVQSGTACAGVMFSVDTETGFDKVVVINASWGLGENVVQGTVDPDEYQVFKPLLDSGSFAPVIKKKLGSKELRLVYGSKPGLPTENLTVDEDERHTFALNDQEVLKLAKWACLIENHYQCPMDMEWAKDGENGKLYIVQARPETVQSQKSTEVLETFRVVGEKETLVSGVAIGKAVVPGRVCLIPDISGLNDFVEGSILVTRNTNPDWVPIMKRAAAIVTDHGGRTSHAAIVSRELGVPAVIGTGNATELLDDEMEITVSCGEGDEGYIYIGNVDFLVDQIDLGKLPSTHTKLMVNLANPSAASRWWHLPADGVGLARMEFIINEHIKVHPMALVHFDKIQDADTRSHISRLTQGYSDKRQYFIDRLATGLARIAAVFYPRPTIIRLSDFKTNEYSNLIGGKQFETLEENPMIGFRGASRYYSSQYQAGFELECQAIVKLRNELGFRNCIVMVPFCRTVEEAQRVIATLKEYGLERGIDDLKLYMMCEVPSNVVQAAEFAKFFDGFSIGSNDLTQLTLGIDRDSAELASLFDERNEAVKWMIEHAISEAHKAGIEIGICGQAPSDYPEFAGFLVERGITSLSVTPDSFAATRIQIAKIEDKLSSNTNRDPSQA